MAGRVSRSSTSSTSSSDPDDAPDNLFGDLEALLSPEASTPPAVSQAEKSEATPSPADYMIQRSPLTVDITELEPKPKSSRVEKNREVGGEGKARLVTADAEAETVEMVSGAEKKNENEKEQAQLVAAEAEKHAHIARVTTRQAEVQARVHEPQPEPEPEPEPEPQPQPQSTSSLLQPQPQSKEHSAGIVATMPKQRVVPTRSALHVRLAAQSPTRYREHTESVIALRKAKQAKDVILRTECEARAQLRVTQRKNEEVNLPPKSYAAAKTKEELDASMQRLHEAKTRKGIQSVAKRVEEEERDAARGRFDGTLKPLKRVTLHKLLRAQTPPRKAGSRENNSKPVHIILSSWSAPYDMH